MPDNSSNVGTDPDAIQLLSPAQVAAVVRTTERTVYRLVRAGVLPPPIKFGRASRWRRTAIEAAVADLECQLHHTRKPEEPGCSDGTMT